MESTPSIYAMRHSCAHVMAAAIQELWPTAKFGVGPPVENGFYYDVLFPEPITLEDLGKIERVMRKLSRKRLPFVRTEVPIETALESMRTRGQEFKVELINLLRDKGSTAVAEAVGDESVVDGGQGLSHVTLYEVGQFVDLCRGPHVGSSDQIGHFKLHRLAGAYWRGNEHNPQLQRLYGLCYVTEEELNAEVARLEEVKLRDHRKIGKELEIFHLSREVGAGLPLWLPHGTVIREELEFLAKQTERRDGYQRVATPHITLEDLYFQSGHLPYYQDDMYAPMEIEGRRYYLRPMNCPHHHHVFLSKSHSYRDLPVRLAEYGQVYRHEQSGTLSGLMRTRGFCQNDAHIYCRYDQAKSEFRSVMDLHARYYRMFGIEAFFMRLSLPDLSNLNKYVDQPAKWVEALRIIREAMEESGLPYREAKGEAAFYGPKIDFIIKSAIGTEHAISTNQLDFLASERFNLTYKGQDGADHPVYVIHRAPLGSHERFIAFLIEHYNGNFPIWLAPIQVVIVAIADRHLPYAEAVLRRLDEVDVRNGSFGVRAEIDTTGERMQRKLRTASMKKIPLVLVVGDNEMNSESVSVRLRGGRDVGQVALSEFCEVLTLAIEQRSDAVVESRFQKPVPAGSIEADRPVGTS